MCTRYLDQAVLPRTNPIVHGGPLRAQRCMKNAPASAIKVPLMIFGLVTSPLKFCGVRRHRELFAQTNVLHSMPIHRRPPTLSFMTRLTA